MSFDLHDSEFERWIRDQTEQHRLFAEESVWIRIQQRLNRRRWFPLVLSLLLITSGAVSWVMVTNPSQPAKLAAFNKIPSDRTAALTSQYKSVLYDRAPNSSAAINQAARTASAQTTDLSFLTWAAMQSFEADQEPIHLPDTKMQSIANGLATPTSSTIVESEAQPIQLSGSIKSAIIPQQVEANTSIPLHENLATASTTPANPPASSDNNTISPEQIQTIESVVNTYKGKRTKRSWQLQFNISPTVSYRKLIEDTDALEASRSIMSAAPAMAMPEIESVVKHKPDLGMQIGISVKRQLTKQIAFVGGLQLNVNKYDIRAYAGNREVATVGLNNGGSTGSVSSFTNYRSSGGSLANWLANFYFSASAPIGLQVRLAGNKKWYWGIGSTLQPTCILSNQTYILSTDFKNYLELPSLVRRWNVNSQAETFIGFQGKKLHYTLGPQARYQMLSSFDKSYPVREHLFDIGLKLGVGL